MVSGSQTFSAHGTFGALIFGATLELKLIIRTFIVLVIVKDIKIAVNRHKMTFLYKL